MTATACTRLLTRAIHRQSCDGCREGRGDSFERFPLAGDVAVLVDLLRCRDVRVAEDELDVADRLHYLRLADYGKHSIAASTAIFNDDPSISTRVISIGGHTSSCTFIADFCIDLAHRIRVIGSTSHARSLHAEFTVFEGQTRVACWYKPVVKRLFWMGYPLELHARLTPEMEEQIELSRRYDRGTLPKTVVLDPTYTATSAC